MFHEKTSQQSESTYSGQNIPQDPEGSSKCVPHFIFQRLWKIANRGDDFERNLSSPGELGKKGRRKPRRQFVL
jgi:hypothetical protein